MTATRVTRWRIIVLAGSVGSVASVGLHVTGPIRPLLVFLFVALCPGLAFVRLLALDPLLEIVAGVATSVGLATLASEALVLVRLWSSDGLLIGLAALACFGALIPARPDVNDPAGRT